MRRRPVGPSLPRFHGRPEIRERCLKRLLETGAGLCLGGCKGGTTREMEVINRQSRAVALLNQRQGAQYTLDAWSWAVLVCPLETYAVRRARK